MFMSRSVLLIEYAHAFLMDGAVYGEETPRTGRSMGAK